MGVLEQGLHWRKPCILANGRKMCFRALIYDFRHWKALKTNIEFRSYFYSISICWHHQRLHVKVSSDLLKSIFFCFCSSSSSVFSTLAGRCFSQFSNFCLFCPRDRIGTRTAEKWNLCSTQVFPSHPVVCTFV